MKFETKVVISVIFSLMVGLSILNLVSFTLLKREVESRILKEVELYALLHEKNYKLPPYIVVSRGVILSRELKPILSKNGKIYWVDVKYPEKRIKEVALTIFLWEVALLLLLGLVTANFVNRYLRQEKEMRDYLKVILLVFTHKLGNFLSLQRVNLEILKNTCRTNRALKRMEEGYTLMEKDFLQLLSAVRKMGEEEEVEPVNLREVVEDTIKHFSHLLKEKTVHLSLQDVYVPMRKGDAENLFFFILDNAVKYSSSWIKVRVGKCKGRNYFVCINDINKNSSKGSGVGLELVKFICKRYRFKLRLKRNGDFLLYLSF